MDINLSPHIIINNRYQPSEKIGEGGMSVVWRAKDIEQNCDRALKFLKKGVTSSYIEDIIRFKREIETVISFNHTNIVEVFAADEYEDTPFIVMELLDGDSLSALFQKGYTFNAANAVSIVRQIAETLQYVHSKGVIHRDIKPGNIVITEHNDAYSVKLVDFGVAMVMELGEIREEDEIVGTFGYMSPEVTGIIHRRIDERSDLYSLGVIMYQLLTRELPFKGKDISKILHQQVASTPQRPRDINSGIEDVLDQIVMKLLMKEPELRYQSAQGLLYDLDRYIKGQRDFVAGECDQKIKLTFQTGFIGRQNEFEVLNNMA